MLAELEIVVFLKSHDNLSHVAERVFGTLDSAYELQEAEEWGGTYAEAGGLGFTAALFTNTGDMLDPEFDSYQFGLEITSNFWCIDLDEVDLEGPLSEYYARLLAFDLDLETASETLIETTEESKIYEIRAFRRNPQFRLDQAPTTPKVFVIETRQVEEPYEEEWNEDDEDEEEDEGEDER